MKNWLSKIKLITWDLDGTLYPPNQDFSKEIDHRKFARLAKHLSCSLKEAKEKFEKVLSEVRSHTKTLDVLGLNGSDFFVEIWKKIDLSLYIKKNPKLVKLFLGKNTPPHAMLTNSNSRENIQKKLALIGLKPEYFSFIITSVETGYGKPNPQIFRDLIEKVQLLPKEILYVGDREKVDILPPKQLGIKTCIVGSESTEADLSVKKPEELLMMFTS